MLGSRITIDTRGVQGAPMLLQQFLSGLMQRLSPVLLTTARQLRSEMQARAPVRTGFMRSQIIESQINALTVMIRANAPYSGYVNFGMGSNRFKGPRPYFTSVIDELGDNAFSERFAQESMAFLNELIARYQRGP